MIYRIFRFILTCLREHAHHLPEVALEHWKAVRSGSRRDLSRAVTLLEIIERREKINREQLHLRIARVRVYSNQYSAHHGAMSGGQVVANHSSSRKEKRQYKKPKHKIQKDRGGTSTSGSALVGAGSSWAGTDRCCPAPVIAITTSII
ncbi:enhancer of polycomb [Culex quinquefasciatus]|uniref:Enhancer of polycomb n=1 Tax=Culex quinquefasciatus TaxID=7176 RepID=B0XA41_CULQU|nr:enhancer of polycomb [Culex quinquefasciatus]|eukprot:XP_001866513.1 enhancer of polycomb [Culex quinquefasciatus]